ncbi:hypothetical protein ACGFMM_03555 [Streptomyces sp. NPDC048604]|uniref:hypothetical protein n=1 Tax=Streptomyces sp. NPDC048604 TaxID=3365578 RepID=UPI00371B80E5
MTWTYCEEWNELLESPMDPLTVEETRSRHDRGKLYTALLQPDEKQSPELRVEIRWETEYASVVFMDDHGRDELRYTFTVVDDKMFLKTIMLLEYGDTEERGGYANPERTERFSYTPDGICDRTVDADGDVTEESRWGVDVSRHWEPIPEFGTYASLIRRERWRP